MLLSVQCCVCTSLGCTSGKATACPAFLSLQFSLATFAYKLSPEQALGAAAGAHNDGGPCMLPQLPPPSSNSSPCPSAWQPCSGLQCCLSMPGQSSADGRKTTFSFSKLSARRCSQGTALVLGKDSGRSVQEPFHPLQPPFVLGASLQGCWRGCNQQEGKCSVMLLGAAGSSETQKSTPGSLPGDCSEVTEVLRHISGCCPFQPLPSQGWAILCAPTFTSRSTLQNIDIMGK